MRTLRQFKNMIRETFRGIWRNKTLGSASTISIAAVLLLFGMVVLMVLNVNKVVYHAGLSLDKVVIYLSDDVTEDQRRQLMEAIEKDDKVKSVTYTSKEQALEEFSQQLNEDKDVLEALPGNPLPESLNVKVTTLEDAQAVVEQVKGYPGIDKVQYFNELVEKMITVSNGIKFGGIGITVALLFIAIVLIHNTIKVALNNRHREIKIMKYVGAKNGYISGPFLMEGMWFGLVGAGIASAVTYLVYDFIFTRVNEQLLSMMDASFAAPETVMPDLILIYLCIGIGIGYLGSAISVARYLDV